MNIFQKIKVLFAGRKLIKQATKEATTMEGETKPGWQTSEFWTKNIVQLVTLYNMIAKHDIPPETGLAILAALEAVYIGGRSIVKGLKALAETYKTIKNPATPAQ